MSGMGGVAGVAATATSLEKMFIPLQFWFCRNPGLALPLIALQYHEVKLNLTFGVVGNVTETAAATLTAKLFVDYIYLDTDERRRFAQVSHEYLIEQLQFQDSASGTTHDLNFNHPVKELIWTGGVGAASTTLGPSTPVAPAAGNYKLTLNGHDRFASRDVTYFTRVQVWQHHTGVSGLDLVAATPGNDAEDNIAVYSFALNPEEHQPSGTCNFSRIDNAQLKKDGAAGTLYIYAVNYNVLRIMSGMGGLAYSN
jgi:hypothetical protein